MKLKRIVASRNRPVKYINSHKFALNKYFTKQIDIEVNINKVPPNKVSVYYMISKAEGSFSMGVASFKPNERIDISPDLKFERYTGQHGEVPVFTEKNTDRINACTA